MAALTFTGDAGPLKRVLGSRRWPWWGGQRTKKRRRIRRRGLRLEWLETRQMLHGDALVDSGGDLVDHAGEMADFSLVDVNPTSATYGQNVFPRDYLNQVSVWLFGWAT